MKTPMTKVDAGILQELEELAMTVAEALEALPPTDPRYARFTKNHDLLKRTIMRMEFLAKLHRRKMGVFQYLQEVEVEQQPITPEVLEDLYLKLKERENERIRQNNQNIEFVIGEEYQKYFMREMQKIAVQHYDEPEEKNITPKQQVKPHLLLGDKEYLDEQLLKRAGEQYNVYEPHK